MPLISARPSFAVSVERLEPAAAQRLGRGAALARRVAHLALADQGQRAVGQRREVAAGPERAVLGHDRREPGVQQSARIASATSGRAPE